MTTRTLEREQFLTDVITGAIEGGTGYWAVCLQYRRGWAVIGEEEELRDYCERFLATEGRKVKVEKLIEERKAYEVTVKTIATGVGRIKRGEVTVNPTIAKSIKLADRENDGGYIDAACADVIVQAGLFGEVVYG